MIIVLVAILAATQTGTILNSAATLMTKAPILMNPPSSAIVVGPALRLSPPIPGHRFAPARDPRGDAGGHAPRRSPPRTAEAASAMGSPKV